MNTNPKVLIVGSGLMAKTYAKVLQNLGILPLVVGRSKTKTQNFEKETSINAIKGGIDKWLLSKHQTPDYTIVATNVDQLGQVAVKLLKNNVKKILLEKPAGLNSSEVQKTAELSKKLNAKVFAAYNRRFYSSTIKAAKIIKKDGGVLSFHFDFSEISPKIEALNYSSKIKKQWFFINSTHIIDLAFFLGGEPFKISSNISGYLKWHPKASIFTGSGETKKGALFSYHANWQGAGRWLVELVTAKHKLILKPLEELKIQQRGGFSEENIKLSDDDDIKYKPGIYKQTKAFLNHDFKNLLTIDEHYHRIKNIYEKIIKNPI